MLNRFIPYFGGKGALAKLYPAPRYNTIVEPFAGGASYALRYHHKNVLLVDKDPNISDLWWWLIHQTNAEEILSLPLEVEDLRELDISEGGRLLIGWWIGQMNTQPRSTPTPWYRELLQQDKNSGVVWSSRVRARIARQLPSISHWNIVAGDYSLANFVTGEATWFIDPPYHNSGTHYLKSVKGLDLDALGDWCRSLPGQVIVCEQEGADWLPFQPLCNFSRKGRPGPKTGREVVWLSDGNYRKQMKGFGL